MVSKMPNICPTWFMKPPADQKTSPAPPPPKPPPLKPSLYSAFDAGAKTIESKPPTTGSIHIAQPDPYYLMHKIDGLDELTKAIVSLKETMERCETRLANIQADLEFTRFPEIKK